ncbi:MAG: hypothetical protein JNN27_13390 [Planctomycetes bacterium]|nr:hypothetical protein [Planctomycetota bacterium]
MLLALAAATLCALNQGPTREELASDLQAMRHGRPGQAEFDAAAPSLGALLESQDEALVAGAAYLVGVHDFEGYAELLVEVLRRDAQRPVEAPKRARLHALDALAQLGRSAPPDVLLGCCTSECASAVYAMLAREQDAERRAAGLARLVALGLRSEPAHWAALVDLTLLREPRALGDLLHGEAWELELDVVDPGAHHGSSSHTSGFGYAAARWPPHVSYSIRLPDLNSQLRSAEIRRVEVAAGCRSMSTTSVPRLGWRLRLLREFAPSAPLSAAEFKARVEFDNAEQVLEAVEAHVARVRARIAALVNDLAATKLVDPAAVNAKLRFQVAVKDLRAADLAPLPHLANRGDVTFRVR